MGEDGSRSAYLTETPIPDHRTQFVNEFRRMLHIALPVVAAELGWMAMSVVDTMMVGRLSAEAIGAVSIGTVLFYAVGVVGTGMLLGLDTLVPQAFGAKRFEECHRWLFHALGVAVPLGAALMLPLFLALDLLPHAGLTPEVATQAAAYTEALLWSTIPLLVFMAFRHYLQGINHVRPVMVVILSANVINGIANWVFIFGNLGAPAYGAAGAGWASCVARVYMCVALMAYVVWQAQRDRTGLFQTDRRIEWPRMARLMRLSFPAAMQRGLEIGVFAVATFLVGTLGAIPLAAHQVALQAASVTFMVPLGISTAAAVRVGQAIGRRDYQGARRSGFVALALGALFMGFAGVIFLLFPGVVVRFFSPDPAVLATGTVLLFVAAAFQLFDGFQVVATGALRGAGETRTPMLANLFGHWFVGLPIGAYLGLRLGWGASGVWIGLCIGLILVGAYLAWVWSVRVHDLPAA
jgi:MATE family multidrug resistance protein